MTDLLPLGNGSAVETAALPVLPLSDLHDAIAAGLEREWRLCALFAEPWADGRHRLWTVLADDRAGRLHLGGADLHGKAFPSLTPRCPSAHLFEREIHEQTGRLPSDHPWLKPVRFPGDDSPVGLMDFYRIDGEGIHEVAVGPVHAGVIEPGHFRFQCDGEHVFHLEISLGYQHRGVEQALRGGPDRRTLHLLETLAGDTTIAHATAGCHVVEALCRATPPAHAQAVRAIALELERLANHVGDLGALANDIGFLPTASYCGRLRGDYLNLTALLCGNRFGRGLLRPGGVRFALDPAMATTMRDRLRDAARDTRGAVDLLWRTPSVMARFENTGTISAQVAVALGMVGPAARASGATADVRSDHPLGMYRFLHVPSATALTGDVLARAFVRAREVDRSVQFLEELLAAMPALTGDSAPAPPPRRGDLTAVALVEGWRGEVCHVARTAADGSFAHYKVVDPSFHNWPGVAMALRDQQISDFPLCNKSFNLSYCGHDL